MIEVNSENYNLFHQKAKEIDDLLETINHDTMDSSNHADTTNHSCFKQLVNMGNKIIPYIFYLMTQHGCEWAHLLLLSELVGNEMQIPEEHYGRFIHIMSDWLQWYIKSPYQMHDVYYGLVE